MYIWPDSIRLLTEGTALGTAPNFSIGQESSKIDNLTWFQLARWFQEYAVWFLGIARNRNRPKEPDRPVEPGRFLRAWFHEYAVWLNEATCRRVESSSFRGRR